MQEAIRRFQAAAKPYGEPGEVRRTSGLRTLVRMYGRSATSLTVNLQGRAERSQSLAVRGGYGRLHGTVGVQRHDSGCEHVGAGPYRSKSYHGGGGLLAAGGKEPVTPEVAGAPLAGPATDGIASFWPTWSLSGSVRLLAWTIASTELLLSAAMLDNVSPDLTV